MSERFSPEEVNRILERAADLDDRRSGEGARGALDAGDLSRDDLERVAVESGISLASLRTVLAQREVAPPTIGERLLGGPFKSTRVVVFDRVLDEVELERAVAIARTEIGGAGRMERLGGTLAWMGVLGGSTPVEVIVESHGSSTTIRIGARFDGLIGGLYGGIGGGLGGGLSYFWVSGAMALLGEGPQAVTIGLGLSMGAALLLARTLYGSTVSKRLSVLARLEDRLRSELPAQGQSPTGMGR